MTEPTFWMGAPQAIINEAWMERFHQLIDKRLLGTITACELLQLQDMEKSLDAQEEGASRLTEWESRRTELIKYPREEGV